MSRTFTKGNSYTSEQHRAIRRAHRQEKLYSQIKDAVCEISKNFKTVKTADLWSRDEDSSGRRKIEGHPGRDATMYVAETLGDFDVPGTVKARYVGTNRSAGAGGHGITDGVLNVEVEIKPIKGVAQIIDVPVHVKNGYMLQPGLFMQHGTPVVLAQSSINDLMDAASFKEYQPDRKNMYSPVNKLAGKTIRTANRIDKLAADLDHQLHLTNDSNEPDLEEVYYHDMQHEDETPESMDHEATTEHEAVSGRALPRPKGPTSKEEMDSAMKHWDERNPRSQEKKRPMRKREPLETNYLPSGPDNSIDLNDHSRSHDKLPPARLPKVGKLAKVASEIIVPVDEEHFYRIAEGATVQVLGPDEEFVLVRQANGLEVRISPEFLKVAVDPKANGRNGDPQTYEAALAALNSGNWGMARELIATMTTFFSKLAKDKLPTMQELIGKGIKAPPSKLGQLVTTEIDKWNRAVEMIGSKVNTGAGTGDAFDDDPVEDDGSGVTNWGRTPFAVCLFKLQNLYAVLDGLQEYIGLMESISGGVGNLISRISNKWADLSHFLKKNVGKERTFMENAKVRATSLRSDMELLIDVLPPSRGNADLADLSNMFIKMTSAGFDSILDFEGGATGGAEGTKAGPSKEKQMEKLNEICKQVMQELTTAAWGMKVSSIRKAAKMILKKEYKGYKQASMLAVELQLAISSVWEKMEAGRQDPQSKDLSVRLQRFSDLLDPIVMGES